MDFYFSLQSQEKIKLSRQLEEKGQGFLIGQKLGQSMIIDDLYFINIFKENIDKIYPSVLNTYKSSLLGTFFFNSVLFNSEWFVGEIILEITKKNCLFFELFLDKNMDLRKRELKKSILEIK